MRKPSNGLSHLGALQRAHVFDRTGSRHGL